MSDSSAPEIPRYIDDPPQIFFWSADELAPIMMGMIGGILIDKIGLCMLIGFATTKIYQKFNSKQADGYILHFLYWYGFLPTKARTMPNPYIKRFLS